MVLTPIHEELRESLAEFHPKSAMQTEKMADLDGAVADAVKLKFLDAPLTKEQLAANIEGMAAQMRSFLDFDAGSSSALLVNNFDWTGGSILGAGGCPPQAGFAPGRGPT